MQQTTLFGNVPVATTANGGTYTPWGKSDQQTRLGSGITSHSTASHGGIKVASQMNRLIPVALRNENGWYEEDCEATIVLYYLRHHITYPAGWTARAPEDLLTSIKAWHPCEYEKATGEVLAEGESYMKDKHYYEPNKWAGGWTVRSRAGSWKAGVPKGCVLVFAQRVVAVGKDWKPAWGIQPALETNTFLMPEDNTPDYWRDGDFPVTNIPF